ncbi:MAG: serine/threonine protein kinase, partial [Xanthomonadales bacterium]|nr:serine/threonine protein kinase [Xanthomonadales bacterium]
MARVTIPGYTIERELGSGGMAKVYLAIQHSLERKVALKVMSPILAADESFSKRFLREARTIAGLTHPNIVAIYEVGVTVDNLHFFAMQHLPGGDFASRMREGVSEAELRRVLGGIGRALGFAHERGFVHRDVTPANILFDPTGNPVLTDFGIARAVGGSTRITHTGVSIGTSIYMSPEQARGAEVDARSDLYSLGVLAYEALTGDVPYKGADSFAVAYAHVFEPIPRLPTERGNWQGLIDKALAKDP